MDARITKKRLGQMLSYDWIKILLAIVAMIVVWSLVFTMTATKLLPSQSFTVFSYTGCRVTDKFNALPLGLQRDGVFSYDVLEISTNDPTVGDMTETILEARFAVQEGRVMFVPDVADENATFTDENGETYNPTYAEYFTTRYYYNVVPMGDVTVNGTVRKGYLTRMREFLNGYFGDYTAPNAEVNAEKAENVFRARIEENNDKRYKNEEQIAAGLKDEIARIEKYRESLLAFERNLADGKVALTTLTVNLSDGHTVTPVTGEFSINVCPDESKSKLRDLVFYENAEKVKTAKDMQIVMLDLLKSEYEYSLFESLAFVNYIVDGYAQ